MAGYLDDLENGLERAAYLQNLLVAHATGGPRRA